MLPHVQHAEHRLGLATLFGGDLPAGVVMMEQALAQLAWIGAAAGDEKRAAVLFGVADPAFYALTR